MKHFCKHCGGNVPERKYWKYILDTKAETKDISKKGKYLLLEQILMFMEINRNEHFQK